METQEQQYLTVEVKGSGFALCCPWHLLPMILYFETFNITAIKWQSVMYIISITGDSHCISCLMVCSEVRACIYSQIVRHHIFDR